MRVVTALRSPVKCASLAVVLALAPCAVSAGGSGCVYDWEIGAPAADAGIDSGGGGGSGSGDGGGGGSGSGSGGGPDCDALTTDVDETRKAAKACTIGASGECDGSIKDECGCTSYVKDASSAQAAAYEAAVSALLMSGCALDCTSCLAGSGTCLLSSGMGPYCLP